MSVRKRTWTNADGPQEAWIVDYVDQYGKRHIKSFRKKKSADAYHATVAVQVPPLSTIARWKSPRASGVSSIWTVF